MENLSFPAAAELIASMRDRGCKLALAESCTCGMTAAILGRVPGASEVFCGSAVTYRESAKTEWLGVGASVLRQFTAESRQTTDELARKLLQRTSEADWGAAITGHLGPGAPPQTDGHVFVSLAHRAKEGGEVRFVARHEFVLTSQARGDRQLEAARAMISWILLRTNPVPVALNL